MKTMLAPHQVKNSRSVNITLWALQVMNAAMFLMAGSTKLSGVPMMVHVFQMINFGQWFRYLTGGIEVISAILLLTPWFSGIGAVLLIGVMVGAIITHLFIIGGNPMTPAILLLTSLLIAWGRREQLLRILGLYH